MSVKGKKQDKKAQKVKPIQHFIQHEKIGMLDEILDKFGRKQKLKKKGKNVLDGANDRVG